MGDALRVVCEIHERMWGLIQNALEDLGDEEIDWRPIPEANTINRIVRHLRIEAEWHLNSLERGEPIPTIATSASQEAIDDVSLNFEENVRKLTAFYTRFLQVLRTVPLDTLRQRTATAYGETNGARGDTHLLAYHQAMHLAMHCGQIRTIRNLYRKTRGEPALFFPENPTYP